MKTTMLLADSAEAVNGKLYVLGGGWSVQSTPGVVRMALAIKIDVPWTEANRQIPIHARLLSEDGVHVSVDERPVEVLGEIEVGRPPGVKPGSELDATLAINLTLSLGAGGYRWELDVDGSTEARIPFRVLPARP
jgi:hypothetical protein